MEKQQLIDRLRTPDASFPMLLHGANDKVAHRIREKLAQMAAGLEAGKIANPVIEDVKFVLGRYIGAAWDTHVRPSQPTRGDDWTDTENAISVPYSIHELKTGATKLGKLLARAAKNNEAVDTPYIRAAQALYAQLAPIAEANELLKPLVVKRKLKTQEEKAAEETYVPPMANKAAEAALRDTLTGITETHYAALRDTFIRQLRQALEQYLAATGPNSTPEERRKAFRNPLWNAIGSRCTRPPEGSVAYRDHHPERRPDADQIIEQEATREADLIREKFVIKNLRKLASIVDGKGDFKAIDTIGGVVSLNSLTGSFRIHFTDGSAFTAENSVVINTSVYGKRFYQFPLRFHDVVLTGGATKKQASEQWMNETFAGLNDSPSPATRSDSQPQP